MTAPWKRGRAEFRVPRGHERDAQVILEYERLCRLHGRKNVDFIIEEPPNEPEDPDKDVDLANRDSVRDITRESE